MATLSPAFLDELRQRLTLSSVVGRKVRLVRRGREHSGLCPFHNEKSPSFTVNDDKGFFHCFGCGAHGDVIGFVMRADGLQFPEAVETLAAEAGMQMPKADPVERARAERAATLYDVLEAAALWFIGQLETQAGAEGKRYLLEKRGLRPETVRRFRLGYAPGGFTALKQAMLARGLTEAQLIAAGLVKQREDGGDSFDYFRDRVIFPITDKRGRVIAFGGRALGENPAKYLNSPETELFHQGANLYNLATAREAARAAGTVIVAEGYMDVIALAQGGFAHAVAPLGTALTEAQMEVLWQLSDEPLLCFDGDAAGLRAGYRAADRALPLLKPGRSFRFALLPGGRDPDDLIKAEGPQAMNAVLAEARPLSDILWRRATEGQAFPTPERQAQLRHDLMVKLCEEIGDQSVKEYYRQFFKDRLYEFFRPGPRGPRPVRQPGPRPGGPRGTGGRWDQPPPPPQAVLPPPATETNLADRQLLVAAITHPEMVHRQVERFVHARFRDPEWDALKTMVANLVLDFDGLDSEGLRNHLKSNGFAAALGVLDGDATPKIERYARSSTPPDEVLRDWIGVLDRHDLAALEDELLMAQRALEQDLSEDNLARLVALQAERDRLRIAIGESRDGN